MWVAKCRADPELVRRRLLAPLLLACALLASSADAGTSPLQARRLEVVSAVPASEAYYADHGTYAGMSVAKLRRAYDSSLKNIVVRKATRSRYCIGSTRKPFVHYDGPGGPARRGRCGTRGAVVPRPASSPSTPPKTTTAEQRLRAAVPAIEGYAADHGGYAGMTLAGLRNYDAGIVDITIVRASRDTYCIESGTGAEMFHKNGPGESSAPGSCPAA
jgi:hypothetical protein